MAKTLVVQKTLLWGCRESLICSRIAWINPAHSSGFANWSCMHALTRWMSIIGQFVQHSLGMLVCTNQHARMKVFHTATMMFGWRAQPNQLERVVSHNEREAAFLNQDTEHMKRCTRKHSCQQAWLRAPHIQKVITCENDRVQSSQGARFSQKSAHDQWLSSPSWGILKQHWVCQSRVSQVHCWKGSPLHTTFLFVRNVWQQTLWWQRMDTYYMPLP